MFALLAAAGAAAPACGDGETSGDGQGGDDASRVAEAQASIVDPTCVDIVRGGAGNVKDTYVDGTSPNSSFSASTTLKLGVSLQVLMSFDFSLVVPPGSSISKATLRLRTLQGNGGGINVHQILKGWTESTTYNQFNSAPLPAFGATLPPAIPITPLGSKTWDATTLAKAWFASPASNNGVLLESDVGSSLNSSEAVRGRPTLTVCYYKDVDGDGFTEDVDCDDHAPAVHPGVAEICDGIDNNCDGIADEGNPGGGVACTTGLPGVCKGGTTACSGGSIVCNQNNQPSSEVCDGADNDCNSVVDDGNPGGGADCFTGNLGECAGGVTACSGGSIVCSQNKQPSGEACDGLDNDCNGVVDNGNPGGGAECGTGKLGVCAVGTTACSQGALQCNQNVQASAEICDGLDNDCDGAVDDNPQPCVAPGQCQLGGGCVNGACIYAIVPDGTACDDGMACTQTDTCQGGACVGSNPVPCGGGQTSLAWDPQYTGDSDQTIFPGWFDEAIQSFSAVQNVTGLAFAPAPGLAVVWSGEASSHFAYVDFTIDLFDAQNNQWVTVHTDSADNGSVVTFAGLTVNIAPAIPVVTAIRFQCAPFEQWCFYGFDVGDIFTLTGSAAGGACDEECDGLDNNCNGQVDEGNPGGGAPCFTGQLGVCSQSVTACVGGGLVCLAPPQPKPEVCDGLDNDCDGQVDEGCIPLP